MYKRRYQGAKILDLGFEDGLNHGLLFDLGFDVYAVEILADIAEQFRANKSWLGRSV